MGKDGVVQSGPVGEFRSRSQSHRHASWRSECWEPYDFLRLPPEKPASSCRRKPREKLRPRSRGSKERNARSPRRGEEGAHCKEEGARAKKDHKWKRIQTKQTSKIIYKRMEGCNRSKNASKPVDHLHWTTFQHPVPVPLLPNEPKQNRSQKTHQHIALSQRDTKVI